MLFRQQLNPTEQKPKGPYSYGIQVGDAAFINGMVGIDLESQALKSTEFKAQLIQTFENIEDVLSVSNLSLENIVSLTIYVKDMSNTKIINQVSALYLSAPYPTRSIIAVRDLGENIEVMVDVVAYDTRKCDAKRKILEDDCGGSGCQD